MYTTWSRGTRGHRRHQKSWLGTVATGGSPTSPASATRYCVRKSPIWRLHPQEMGPRCAALTRLGNTCNAHPLVVADIKPPEVPWTRGHLPLRGAEIVEARLVDYAPPRWKRRYCILYNRISPNHLEAHGVSNLTFENVIRRGPTTGGQKVIQRPE